MRKAAALFLGFSMMGMSHPVMAGLKIKMIDDLHIVISGNYMGELAQNEQQIIIKQADFAGSGLTETFLLVEPHDNKNGQYGDWLLSSYTLSIKDINGNPNRLAITITPVTDKTGQYGAKGKKPIHFEISNNNSANKNLYTDKDKKPLDDIFVEFARVPEGAK